MNWNEENFLLFFSFLLSKFNASTNSSANFPKSKEANSLSSIFNILTLLKRGFTKVRDYTFAKKLLLLGFFSSSLLQTVSISTEAHKPHKIFFVCPFRPSCPCKKPPVIIFCSYVLLSI